MPPRPRWPKPRAKPRARARPMRPRHRGRPPRQRKRRRRPTRTSPSNPSWRTFAGARAAPSNTPMLLVGLTGGIGSGKSTVARMLEKRGAVVFDADVLARQAVAPGTPGVEKGVERVGPHRLAPRGGLGPGAPASLLL